jgi:hypothetical protein
MNILLLGNSNKFEYLVLKLWPKSVIEKVSWRQMTSKGIKNNFDKIFICGYDYESSKYPFKDFLFANVDRPFHFLIYIQNNKTDLIYINTLPASKNFTFSRYLFAKQLLAFNLTNFFKKIYILNIPTIIPNKDIFNSSYGINPVVINLLLKLYIIKAIDFDGLINIIKNYKKHLKTAVNVPKPIFLRLPRTIFVDRFMRILIG